MTAPQQRQSAQVSKKTRIPLAIRMIMAYFILIFVLIPFETADVDQASMYARIPFACGVIMLIGAFLHSSRDAGFYHGLIPTFSWLFGAFVLSGVLGPSGILESFRLFFAQVGIGLALMLCAHRFAYLRAFLTVMLWTAVANALYGLVFMLPGLREIGAIFTSIGLPQGVSADTEFRLVGLARDPTYCGLILMTGLFISLERHMARSRKLISATGLLTIVLVFGILLTVSRTTWVATLAGIMVWFAVRKGTNVYNLLFLGIAFACCYYLVGLVEDIMPALERKADLISNDTRTWIWNSYLNLAIQKPFGYGLGSIEHLRKFATAEHMFYSTARPHNYFLVVWIEMGVQALMPVMVFIILALKRTWPVTQYYDIETNEYPARLALSLTVALCVGLFGLGGLSQLLFVSIALCFLTEGFVKRGELVCSR